MTGLALSALPARRAGARAPGWLRRAPRSMLLYAVLGGHAVLTLFPFAWVLANSFRDNDAILTSVRLLPESLQPGNYLQVLRATNIPRAFFNSVSITLGSLLVLLAVAAPLSFVLARFRFRAARAVYVLFGLAVLVPGVSVLPMTFRLFNALGLLGTKYGICLVYATEQLPITVFLLVAFMRAIPAELDEAAVIDGATVWDVFVRVVLPLSRNGLVTVVILAFVAVWNDYLTALILLPDAANRTLSVALAYAKDEYRVDYGVMAAAIVVASLPMLAAYLVLKDRLTTGLAAGAVKG